MAKNLYNYIKYVDDILKQENVNLKVLREEHLIKIQFYQHERLIHLLVTLFFVIFMLTFFVWSIYILEFIIVALILLICVFCYVIYYFKLENGIQYLYKQYDNILIKLNK